MQLEIFLTGATGYIGSAVAGALLAAGHSVTGLARSDDAAEKLAGKGITPYRGNLTSPESLGTAALAADAVIHTGTTNQGPIDQEAVRALLRGKPLIYTSGVWVLGDTGGKVADETWPVNPIPKVAWRPAVEQMVLDAGGVVIRPAIVFGRGGGIPADFVQSARYVGNGENHWPMIHLDDLALLYVLAIANAPPGTLLHASDGTAFRVKEIAAAASLGAGAGDRTESWPLEEARKTLGAYADALVLDQQVSSQKARATLGWKPRAVSVLDDLRSGSYIR
jgi:nucleoside-diphosphate-sugar epimerase